MKAKSLKRAKRMKPQTQVIHYPRLDTVLMVEKAIRDAPDYPTKTQLWRSLPKGMMYQTLCLILDYLEQSGKILVDKHGQIMWTWNPGAIKRLEAKGLIIK